MINHEIKPLTNHLQLLIVSEYCFSVSYNKIKQKLFCHIVFRISEPLQDTKVIQQFQLWLNLEIRQEPNTPSTIFDPANNIKQKEQGFNVTFELYM